jgi:hypothetical protein
MVEGIVKGNSTIRRGGVRKDGPRGGGTVNSREVWVNKDPPELKLLSAGWRCSPAQTTEVLRTLKQGRAPKTCGLSDIDFQSLRKNALITDAVIDGVGKVLAQDGKISIHSVYFYDLIKDGDDQRCNEALQLLLQQAWSTCINLFPIHTGSDDAGHYVVGIVDMRDGSHCVVDPIGNDEAYESISYNICNFLQLAADVLNIQVPLWTYKKILNIPRQTDSVNCGCYIMMYMIYIVETGWLPQKEEFGLKDMLDVRNFIVWMICRGDLSHDDGQGSVIGSTQINSSNDGRKGFILNNNDGAHKTNINTAHRGKMCPRTRKKLPALSTECAQPTELQEQYKQVYRYPIQAIPSKEWKPTVSQSSLTRAKVMGHEWDKLSGIKTEVLQKVLDGAAIPQVFFDSIIPLLTGDCIVVGPEWYSKLHKTKHIDGVVRKEHLRVQHALMELYINGDNEKNVDKTHLIICKINTVYTLCIMNMSTGLLTVKDMQSERTRQDIVYHSMRIFMEVAMRKLDKVVHKWHGIQQETYSTHPYESSTGVWTIMQILYYQRTKQLATNQWLSAEDDVAAREYIVQALLDKSFVRTGDVTQDSVEVEITLGHKETPIRLIADNIEQITTYMEKIKPLVQIKGQRTLEQCGYTVRPTLGLGGGTFN